MQQPLLLPIHEYATRPCTGLENYINLLIRWRILSLPYLNIALIAPIDDNKCMELGVVLESSLLINDGVGYYARSRKFVW